MGISRAKKNLYVFDHTGYARSFDEIIRDFDNRTAIRPEPQYFESNPDTEDTAVTAPIVVAEAKEEIKEIDILSVFELIDGEIFSPIAPTLKHQRTLTALSSEFYMTLKGTPYQSFLGPMKIRLLKRDGSEHFVQPDLFVLENDNELPVLIIEVISPETRSKDMIKKMALYMNTGIKEYWVVDTDSSMVMVHSFEDYDLKGTKIFVMNQVIESQLFDTVKIEMNDIIL